MVHACCDAVALAIRNRVTNDRGVQPPHCIPPPTTDPSTSPRDGDTCGSLQGELIAHLDELAAQIRGTLIEDTDEQPAGRQVCNCGIQNGTTRLDRRHPDRAAVDPDNIELARQLDGGRAGRIHHDEFTACSQTVHTRGRTVTEVQDRLVVESDHDAAVMHRARPGSKVRAWVRRHPQRVDRTSYSAGWRPAKHPRNSGGGRRPTLRNVPDPTRNFRETCGRRRADTAGACERVAMNAFAVNRRVGAPRAGRVRLGRAIGVAAVLALGVTSCGASPKSSSPATSGGATTAATTATAGTATAGTATAATATAASTAATTATAGSAAATNANATAAANIVPAVLQFTAPLVGGGQFEGASVAGRPVAFWFWAPT